MSAHKKHLYTNDFRGLGVCACVCSGPPTQEPTGAVDFEAFIYLFEEKKYSEG